MDGKLRNLKPLGYQRFESHQKGKTTSKIDGVVATHKGDFPVS
jgi:hypothetical protein